MLPEYCSKFKPNIFHPSKCSTCFKLLEEHSTVIPGDHTIKRKVIKCGYLFIAPRDWDFSSSVQKSKRWQRRWFVLYDDGHLTWSLDEQPDTIPQGTLDMTGVVDVKNAESLTDNQYSLCLSLITNSSVFIKGTSNEEIRSWELKFKSSLLSGLSSSHSSSVVSLVDHHRSQNPNSPCGSSNLSSPTSSKPPNNPSSPLTPPCSSSSPPPSSATPSSKNNNNNGSNSNTSKRRMTIGGMIPPISSSSSSLSTSGCSSSTLSASSSLSSSSLGLCDKKTMSGSTSNIMSSGNSCNMSNNSVNKSSLSSLSSASSSRFLSDLSLMSPRGDPDGCGEKCIDHGPLRKGWLLRYSTTLTSNPQEDTHSGCWSKYWFVLRNSKLLYFTNADEEECLGSLTLDINSRIDSIDSMDRHYGFNVENWTLAAITNGMRGIWIKSLEAARKTTLSEETPPINHQSPSPTSQPHHHHHNQHHHSSPTSPLPSSSNVVGKHHHHHQQQQQPSTSIMSPTSPSSTSSSNSSSSSSSMTMTLTQKIGNHSSSNNNNSNNSIVHSSNNSSPPSPSSSSSSPSTSQSAGETKDNNNTLLESNNTTTNNSAGSVVLSPLLKSKKSLKWRKKAVIELKEEFSKFSNNNNSSSTSGNTISSTGNNNSNNNNNSHSGSISSCNKISSPTTPSGNNTISAANNYAIQDTSIVDEIVELRNTVRQFENEIESMSQEKMILSLRLNDFTEKLYQSEKLNKQLRLKVSRVKSQSLKDKQVEIELLNKISVLEDEIKHFNFSTTEYNNRGGGGGIGGENTEVGVVVNCPKCSVLEEVIKDREVKLSELENCIGDMELQFHRKVQELRDFITRPNSNECHEVRIKYQREVGELKNLCTKGLEALENSHRRMITELEEKHRREIQSLQIEKETALQEETNATLAALDALRKNHDLELQREMTRFKEEFIRKFQDGQDLTALHKEHEEELAEIKNEILLLSDKYSTKCIETSKLEEKIEHLNNLLLEAKRRILEVEGAGFLGVLCYSLDNNNDKSNNESESSPKSPEYPSQVRKSILRSPNFQKV